jgi:hypothetical protein
MQPETDDEDTRPPKPDYKFHGTLPPALWFLRDRPQWLTWDYIRNEKKAKWDKPPLNAHTGKPASIRDPNALGTFKQAAATAKRLNLAGVGLLLKPDDNITGGDLDNCVTDSGSFAPFAAEVVEYGETYMEYSPSAGGVRFLAFGKVEQALKDDKLGVELYGTGRYLTITGNQIEGTPSLVKEAPRTIARLQGAVAASRGETPKAAANGHAKATGGDFFRNVNTAALARLDDWVPALHPTAKKERGTGAWRVTSKGLARDFEEDLAYHQDGIKDHGEEVGLTAVDAVLRYGTVGDSAEAAMWLCRQMGVEPASLGWRKRKAEEKKAGAGNATDKEWPDPVALPAGLLPVAPFDYDMLPDRVCRRVSDIAERMQCPPEFVGVPVMVGLGSVIGRKVGVRPKERDDWTMPANLWGKVVAPPGRLKSPAHNEALTPVKALEAQAREDFKVAKAEYRALKNARGTGDTDDLEEPVQRRYITTNITAEAMGEILKQNPNGVLNVRDELMALLRYLDDPAQATARELYLQGWSGVTGYNFDRIGRGFDNYVPAVCISMFGATQPSLLSRYVTEIRQGGRGNDGLIQRFGLAVWPDPPPKWTYVDRLPDKMAREMAAKVFKKLDGMTPDSVGATQDKIEDKPLGIPYLRFCTEAQVLFVNWYSELEQRLATGEWADDLLKEHISKYRGLMPCLALICHLVDWDDHRAAGPISVEATQKALKWVAYLETHAARIYASGDVTVVEAAYAVIAKLKSGHLLKSGFSSRDVWRPQWSRLTNRPTVKAALELLVDYDWLTAAKVETNGRFATVYTVNPKALT